MEQTTAIGLLERPEVQNTFIKVIQSANRGMSEQEAQLRVQQEVINFQEHCIYNNELANCDPQSVLFGIRKVIGANLSLDKAKGHTYLLPASIKQADGTFKKVLEVSYQAEGLLVLYYNANVIIDHKSPSPKYDNEQGGKVVSITWEYQLANKRWESVTFNEAHFNKWRKASQTKNGRNKSDADLNKMNYANPNYTSFAGGVDPEFASAKCIKHALKKMALDRNRFEPQPTPVVQSIETVDASHEIVDVESGEVIKMYSSNDLNFNA